jgi:hypothetical protein
MNGRAFIARQMLRHRSRTIALVVMLGPYRPRRRVTTG